MVKVSQKTKNQQKALFRECMDLAGYDSYQDLANDVILSLPNGIRLVDLGSLANARRSLAAEIYGLANGKISPIYNDTENKGKMKPLAIEVASLLLIEPENLYFACPELNYAQIDIANAEEEIDERFDSAPDINLVRRDIDMALKTIPEDKREVLLNYIVWGRTQVEIAQEMSIKVSLVKDVIAKLESIWRNRLKTNLVDYVPDSIKDNEIESHRNLLGYIVLPENFNASHFINSFLMNAARINFVCSRQNDIPDSLFVKLQSEFESHATTVERIAVMRTAEGPVLNSCNGSIVTSLLIHFTQANRYPSLQFMRSVMEAVEKKPADYWMGTSGDFRAAVSGIATNTSVDFKMAEMRDTCQKILAIV